jgi:ABC-type lipoprotein release transport system permease subunit
VSRCRSDWPVILAAFVLLTCATTLLAAGVLYSDTVAGGSLRQAVLSASPADRAVVARRSSDPADVEALDATARPELEQTVRSTGGEVSLVVRSGTFAMPGQASDAVTKLTLMASYEDLAGHAALVGGRWPEAGRDPIEATLSEGGAAAMGLAVGDRMSISSRLDPTVVLDVTVTGVWRPDPTDPYWLDDRLEIDGTQAGAGFTTLGPLVASRDDVEARSGSRTVDVQWRAIPYVEGLGVDAADALAADIGSLLSRLTAALPGDRPTTVTAALPDILADVNQAVLVSRSGVLLLTVQFAVLAGYAVFLVAGLLVERRRAEVALLRARGATSAHLITMALIEALLIAVPAAIIAPALAAALVMALGQIGPLASAGIVDRIEIGPATYLAAGAAAAIGVVALTLPSVLATGNLAGVRAAIGRQGSSTLPQRLGIDLVLIVLALIALWQLRLYGAPLTRNARGTLGIDPLLIAAPAIGLLAGAVVAIRVIPRLAELGERLLVRRHGLVSPLGARQLARRPLRYTRSALLLMLAMALGTFAFAFAATWTRSQADQASYQSATGARVVLSEYSEPPGWALGPLYRALPGVDSATPVGRQTLDVGRAVREGQLLGLDGSAVGPVLDIPLDGATGDPGTMLEQLAQSRPATAAIALPGRPRRLAVTVDADLAVPPDGPPVEEGAGATGRIGLAVVLIDGDGRLHRVDGSDAPVAGSGLRLEAPLSYAVDSGTIAPEPPLRLEAIEIKVTAPAFSLLQGTVAIRNVAVSDEASGPAWTTVPFDAGASTWSWLRIDPNSEAVAYRPPRGEPGTISVGGEDPASDYVYGAPGAPGYTFRLSAGVDEATVLPAIVGASFLETSGAKVGDTLAAQTYGQSIRLQIVGALDAFPPLDPTVPFAVVDGPSLELTRFGANGQVGSPQEWWLTLDPAMSDAAVATLRSSPYSAATVIEREELTRALEANPVPLGVIGALGIGALAAMAFASIGFLVSATVSTSERLGEFALLQALGLSRRELSGWLSIESSFLLASGLLAGTALGVLLAWLVLPFATLTDAGTTTVPPAVVVVPWGAVLVLYLLAAVLLVATVALVTRSLSHIPLSGVLRARDG